MAGDILDSLKKRISEREANTDDFSVIMEKSGRFLEITAILTENIHSNNIQNGMALANVYNAKSIFGELNIDDDSGKVHFKLQYLLGQNDDDTEIGRILADNMFNQIGWIIRQVKELKTSADCEWRQWICRASEQKIFFIDDKLLQANVVYAQLKKTLDRYQVSYEEDTQRKAVFCKWNQTENETGETIEKRQRYKAEIDPCRGIVQVLLAVSEPFSKDRIPEYLKCCMDLNKQVWGRFYVNTMEDVVCYYSTAPYSKGSVSSDWIAAQLAVAEYAISEWQHRKI